MVARKSFERYDLPDRCRAVLFSPIFGRIDPREIVEWILADNLARSFPTADAQVHLDADAARGVTKATSTSYSLVRRS